MPERSVAVLFTSQRNSVRSILAQACLNQLGSGRFRAFSCGVPSQLASKPDPLALEALVNAGFQVDGLSCKGWDEFVGSRSIQMNFVINLSDEAHDQMPKWPGQPPTALWNYPDIVSGALRGSDVGKDMVQTLHSLRRRLELFVSLPMRTKDREALRSDVRDMAYMG